MYITGYILTLLIAASSVTESAAVHTKKDNMMSEKGNIEKVEYATFGGGCFWCIEAVFSKVRGVESAISGFAGGHRANPTYEQVVTGATGHAEVVQVAFDPSVVSYLQLLEIFFTVHDPTTLNQQGADVGTQYRSAIFFHNESQKHDAEKVIERITEEKIWDNPIVTEVSPLEQFYAASEYHQNYFEKNPNQGYCQMVIRPKVEKFKKMFDEMIID
jgi:peptide-methionine (S)-S-oxide reductase